jgi:hypothetical protein
VHDLTSVAAGLDARFISIDGRFASIEARMGRMASALLELRTLFTATLPHLSPR